MPTSDTPIMPVAPGIHAKNNKRKKELAKQRKRKAAAVSTNEDELSTSLSSVKFEGSSGKQSSKKDLDKSIYEIKPTPGKGLGTERIKEGTEILREEPIFKGCASWWSHHAMFKVLPQDLKKAYMGLHSQCNCGEKKCNETEFMKIWDANSFEVFPPPLKLEAGYAGPFVYLIASRMNHSCSPNTSQGFTDKCQIVFRAIKDIEVGEEITGEYIGGGARPVADRQERLLKKYHFKCACQLCIRGARLTPMAGIKSIILETITTPGLPVIGGPPPELKSRLTEVDVWYRTILAKLNSILSDTLRDMGQNWHYEDTKMTAETVGYENMQRMVQYMMKNDKYELGLEEITLILLKLQPSIFEEIQEKFRKVTSLWDGFRSTLTEQQLQELVRLTSMSA